MRVGIIGGGITGLSAAFYLEKFSSDVEVVLFEASGRLGGKIFTLVENGFVIEGGPDSIYTFKRGGMELIRELGLEERVIRPPENARAFIYSRGKLRSFPEGFYGLAPKNFIKLWKSELFSFRAKLRMLGEPFVRENHDGDETLGAFVRRRLGEEALVRFAGPLLSGIYASDPEEMSILATFPYYKEMVRKYGSLTKAALKMKRSSCGISPFVSLRGGLEELVRGVVGKLIRTSIMMNYPVEVVEGDRSEFVINGEHRFDRLILAVPAFRAGKMLKSLSKRLSELMMQIPFVSTLTVSFAFRDASLPENSTGFMVARDERKRISACTFSSNKWPGHAPSGYQLVRCFMGRRGDEGILELEDEKIAEIALEELGEIVRLRSAPIFYRVFRWWKAMPQYRVGHLELVEEIKREAPAGLHPAGASLNGIGIPDCIRQGQEAALKALNGLSQV